MPSSIGIQGILLLIVVFTLLFGAKRLPEVGRSLGKGLREFKQAITSVDPGADEGRPKP